MFQVAQAFCRHGLRNNHDTQVFLIEAVIRCCVILGSFINKLVFRIRRGGRMRLEGAVLTRVPEDRQRAVMRCTLRDVGGMSELSADGLQIQYFICMTADLIVQSTNVGHQAAMIPKTQWLKSKI
jgi:hypothetical protein